MWFNKSNRAILKGIAMDISQLKDAFSNSFVPNFSAFATDFTKFTGDMATFLSTVQVTNPADQTAVDNIVAGLRGFGNQVSGFDATVKELDAKITAP